MVLTQSSIDSFSLVRQAWHQYQEGRTEDATNTFAAAAVLDLESPAAQYGVAVCAMHRGDSHLARQILVALIESERIDPPWLFSYAAVCYDFHQYQRAADCLRRYRSLVGSLSPYECVIHQVCTALESGGDIELPDNIEQQWINAAKLLSLATQLPFGTRGTGIRRAVESAKSLSGLDLELGTWRGASAHVICRYLIGTLFCFDRLYGIEESWSGFPANAYSCNGVAPNLPDNARLVVGSLEDSLPEFLSTHNGPIRFVHFDCDTYKATRNALRLVGDRLVSGSVLLFDQYFMNQDWEQSEFAAMKDWLSESRRTAEVLWLSPFTRQGVLTLR